MGVEKVLLGILIVFLCIIGVIYLAHKNFGISCFNLIWTVILAICFEELSLVSFQKTLICLVIMILFVNVGYLVGKLKIRRTRYGYAELAPNMATNTTFNNKLFVYIQLVGFIILAFYMVRTTIAFGFNLSAIRVGNNSDSDTRVLDSIVDTVLFYGIGTPIIYLSAIALAFNMSQKIKTTKSSIFILVLSIVCYFGTVAGRTLIFRILLFFVASIIWIIHDKNRNGKVKIRKYVFIGIVVLGMISVVSVIRDSLSTSFLQQFFIYLKGSVSHMNFQLNRLHRTTDYFGYVTYGGILYYPVKVISLFSGLDIQTSAEILEFLQQPNWINVGGKLVYYNALLPNAYYYYYDMGYLGIILFSSFFGLAIRKSEFLYRRRNFFAFAVWATCLYAIGYSFLGGIWWSSTYPMAILYCWLLKNLLYRAN